jgi:predicted PurR-regulated permease PerM
MEGAPGAGAAPATLAGAGGAASRLSADETVPRLLRLAGAWGWRLVLVGLVGYFSFRIAVALRLVVIPFLAALLVTALLQPLAARLIRAGLPRLAATWVALLVPAAALAGLGTLATDRVRAGYPALAAEVQRTVRQVEHALAGPPFRITDLRLNQLFGRLLNYLAAHKSLVAGTVITGGRIFIEVVAGLILTAFITFFLLKDGNRIWSWLVSGLRPQARARADRAGAAAWQALVSYIRGTTAIAAIHAVIIGLVLWLLGVPLLIPLAIGIFAAAFVPLVGILVMGALAILITLATRGWVAALILLIVLLAENQIEGHLLQPQLVGRLVRLHPLAVIIALAVGGIVAGIVGAIVAVPAAAVIVHAWPYLRAEGDSVP